MGTTITGTSNSAGTPSSGLHQQHLFTDVQHTYLHQAYINKITYILRQQHHFTPRNRSYVISQSRISPLRTQGLNYLALVQEHSELLRHPSGEVRVTLTV